MPSPQLAHAQSLGRFIDRSPSPFHVVDSAISLLSESGFTRADPGDSHPIGAGRFFAPRDGSLGAWVVPEDAPPDAAFRIVGAPTDSPNLRLKPNPDANASGFRRLGVEVSGAVLLNSWLYRDLG